MGGKGLILAYGNPLREDDGVGWQVGEQLAQMLPETAVQVLVCHQLTPELVEPISRAALVIFIDAATGSIPGAIDCRPITSDPARVRPFSHQVDPSGLLLAAQQLYGRVPQAFLLSVTGQSFGYGEGLSDAVLAALPQLVARVRDLVAEGVEATKREA